MTTDTTLAMVVGLLVIVAVVAIGVVAVRTRRSARLRERFGDEYDHTVSAAVDTHEGEALLAERQRRVGLLDIRPLSPQQREAFILSWRQVQGQFVDDPSASVIGADQLLGDVMSARGYPVADFERRYEDLSVDHREAISHYRIGHRIVERHARGEAGTEDLRRAMIHYRALFDDLVNEPEDFSPVIEHRGGKIHDLRKEPTRRI